MSRRTVTRPEVRVGGTWLSTITPRGWGELEHQTRTNGAWQASWSIPIVGNWRHPALVYGARVEVYLGPVCVWSGTLDEPDWDAGTFIATGASRDAENALALDGSGASSTVPNTVIDAAIARGVLPWTRVGNFGTTAVGDSNGGLVTISSVLDAWAQENNSRWYVNEQRQLIISPVTETVPDWLIVPGSGVLGSASDDRADQIAVRYISTTTGLRATAFYPATTPAGGIEAPVDVTDRGAITPATAATIAQAEWEKLKGRSGWTNGLTLIRGQITTKGGTDADLAFVKAGQTMRLLGVPDPRGVAHNLDVVIGDTAYDWTDDQVQLNPVGLAARDDESALEYVGSLAATALQKATSGSSSSTRPVGEVTQWYGAKASIPAGWLPMDGSTFSDTTYPALADFLGSTTLPDMTDRFPVGAGTKAPGATGGAASHAHALSGDGYALVAFGGGQTTLGLNGIAVPSWAETQRFNLGAAATAGSRSVGAPLRGATDNANSLPPWRALWFIIRAA